MKTKIFLALVCFVVVNLQTAYSQMKTEDIPLKKGELPLKINGFAFNAKINKKSNIEELKLSLNELRELKKNKCKITNFKGDTTFLRGKKKLIKLTFNVDTLHLSNCIIYANAPVRIDFYTDSVVIQKPEIGLKLLNNITSIDINASRLKLINVEPPYLKNSCFANSSVQSNQQSSVIAPPSFGINQAIRSSHIKFILCSLDPSIQQKKSDLQNQLRAANCSQVEEETQIPPPYNAVKKINNGFTIRFFSTSDAVLAADMKQFIKTQYPNDDISIEDMSAYYDLPKRLEIWIK